MNQLSVIIPTYNRARLLVEGVRSVLDCGVPGVEVIVVDDGSTDDTQEVLESLDGMVKSIYQENAGVSAARNRGLQASSAPFIAFLDSDDRWLPGPCASMLQALRDNPDVGAVFTDARTGNPEQGYHSWLELPGRVGVVDLPCEERRPGLRVLEQRSFFRRLVKRNLVHTGATIFRRGALVRAGGFDTTMRWIEDWELLLRVASRSTFAFWPEPLLLWTQHDGARLSAQTTAMRDGMVHALKRVMAKCGHLPPEDREWLQSALREMLFGNGYCEYEEERYDEASRRFTELLQLFGWEWRSVFYHLVCGLPPGLIRRLRRLKQMLSRPGEELSHA